VGHRRDQTPKISKESDTQARKVIERQSERTISKRTSPFCRSIAKKILPSWERGGRNGGGAKKDASVAKGDRGVPRPQRNDKVGRKPGGEAQKKKYPGTGDTRRNNNGRTIGLR